MNQSIDKKEKTIKALAIIGAFIGFFMPFCFLSYPTVVIGSDGKTTVAGQKMINWMLGRNGTVRTPGMTTLLIFAIILTILCFVLILLYVTKSLTKKKMIIFVTSICVVLIVCIILSFLTRNFLCEATRDILNKQKDKLDPKDYERYIKELDFTHNYLGPILYSSLGILSFVCFSLSLVLSNIKIKD